MIGLLIGATYKIRYLNHRNEDGYRRVIILAFTFGSSRYYPDKQLLVECYDLDKEDHRTLAASRIKDIVQ